MCCCSCTECILNLCGLGSARKSYKLKQKVDKKVQKIQSKYGVGVYDTQLAIDIDAGKASPYAVEHRMKQEQHAITRIVIREFCCCEIFKDDDKKDVGKSGDTKTHITLTKKKTNDKHYNHLQNIPSDKDNVSKPEIERKSSIIETTTNKSESVMNVAYSTKITKNNKWQSSICNCW